VKKTFFLYLIIASIAVSASFAEFQINTYTSSYQTNSAVAADTSGSFVVVWSSYGQDGSSNGIFGRQFNPDCTPAADEFQINITTAGNQTEPAVAMNASGLFIVAWHGPGISAEDIFARRFDPNGQPLSNEFPVNTITAGSQLCPAVAMNNDGNFIIVWESTDVPEQGKKAICGQLYNHTGSAVGSEFIINDSNEPVCRYPAVVMQDNGKFIVVWVRDSTTKSLWVRHFNADGAAPYLAKKVSDTDFPSLTRPGIAIDANGNYGIVWDGHPSSYLEDDIYIKRYHWSHAPLHSQFRVNTCTTGAQSDPSITMAGDGRFIVVWESDTDSETTKKDIFGQRFPAQGEYIGNPLLTGDEFRINTYLVDDQKYPAVAILPAGRFITVWQSMEQDGSNFGIFGEIGPKPGSADLTHNGFIDLFDFSRLAAEWLKSQNPLSADLIDDNKIDELDLAVLCDHWLTPSYDCTQVDLNDDTRIDFTDYSRWANDWLKQGPNLTGDITSDGFVTFSDLKPISFHWLTPCQ
jgi:hypothetical protein